MGPFRWIDCGRDSYDWTGYDWTGCDWTGCDWTGCDWIGRDSIGSDRIGMRSGLPGVGKWLKPDRVDEARRNLAQPNPA